VLKVTVWGYLDWGMQTLRSAFIALRMDWCSLSNQSIVQCSIVKKDIYVFNYVIIVESVLFLCYMFACSPFYFRLQLPLIIIHITCISLSLCRTSAPIHLTSVLGVLGTQETSCILIAGLLERDIFDHFLPEFDKPWVIHLRETCCYSTNLCTWRPNTVYKNRSVRRHQGESLMLSLRFCVGQNFLLN
jgi:hypothetical protein